MEMIEKIIWPENSDEQTLVDQVKHRITSPFNYSNFNRPLRLTLHISGLKNLPDDEQEALDTLNELNHSHLLPNWLISHLK